MNSIITSPAIISPMDRTVVHVITAAVADRSGDLIVPGGLANRDEFLRNPIVLWAHQRTLPPIGTCIDLQVTNERVIAVTKFASGVQLADDLFRLYEQGILRGWSIGFVPKLAGLRKPTRDGRRGMNIESWDLLEYSAVPVPENPEALTLAIRKGLVKSPKLAGLLGGTLGVFDVREETRRVQHALRKASGRATECSASNNEPRTTDNGQIQLTTSFP